MTVDAKICGKCGKKQRTRSGLTFTQWILDQNSCACDIKPFDASSTAEPTTQICKNCGKALDSGRQGSMTQWIFRGVTCNCGQAGSGTVSESTSVGTAIGGAQNTSNGTGSARAFREEDLDSVEELPLDKQRFPTDRYKPLKELGTGGSGTVYLCIDRLLKKKVAVKTLRQLNAEQLIAFQTEARATSKLNHSAILSLIDFGPTESGTPYMVLEFMDGMTLQELLTREGPLSESRFSTIFEPICSALSHAHANGIFHRDLKPSNVLIRQSDDQVQVKLIDFGVAHVKRHTEPPIEVQGTTIAGTPAYMPPDMVQGRSYDARSEIYSLGCVFFESLTGRPPFAGETALETFNQHASIQPPRLSEIADHEFSDHLENLIATCLEKAPDDRFQSMAEVRNALIQLGESDRAPLSAERDENQSSNSSTKSGADEPARRFKSVAIIASVVAVLCLSVLAWRTWNSPTPSTSEKINRKTRSHNSEPTLALFEQMPLTSASPSQLNSLVSEANLYYNGTGVPQDYRKAFELFSEAADKGSANAQESAAYMLQEGLGTKKDLNRARALFLKAAAQGNAHAQMNLGNMYREGLGVPVDSKQALSWYMKAAAQGQSRALSNIGYLYEHGNGVSVNFKEAEKWYRKGAAAGEGMAYVNLAYMYERGAGVKKDLKEAIRLYTVASKMGIAAADRSLAYLYMTGNGTTQDYKEAFKLFSRAAARNDRLALRWLGYMYYNGMSVTRDDRKAYDYFYKAALQNDAFSQVRLGDFHWDGIAVQKDRHKAAQWYLKAAKQNNSYAQYYLGVYYLDEKDYLKGRQYLLAATSDKDGQAENLLGETYRYGLGVKKDIQEARKWYKRAVAKGNDLAARALKETR